MAQERADALSAHEAMAGAYAADVEDNADIAAALAKVRPSLAQEVEPSGRVALATRDIGSVSSTLARIADAVSACSPCCC